MVALLVGIILVCAGTVSKLFYSYQLDHVNETISAISRATVNELKTDITNLESLFLKTSLSFQNSVNESRLDLPTLKLEAMGELEIVNYIAWVPRINTPTLEQSTANNKSIIPELRGIQDDRTPLRRNQQELYNEGEWEYQIEYKAPYYLFIQNPVSLKSSIEENTDGVFNHANQFKRAIVRATKTGEIVASQAIIHTDGSTSSSLISAIYNRPKISSSLKNLSENNGLITAGVLNLEIDLEKMFEYRTSNKNSHSLGFTVEEVNVEGKNTLLYQTGEHLHGKNFTDVELINFFGHEWKLSVHREPQTWAMLLPSVMAVFLGLIIVIALLAWHTNNRRFKHQLHNRLAEQKIEINKNTRLLEAVLAAAPVGIEYIDESGTIQLQNDLSRLVTSNLVSRNAIHSESASAGTKNGNKLQHYQLQTSAGEEEKYFEFITKEIECSSEHGIGKVIVSNDVTARELANRRLEGYIRELETINGELEEFTYSATHDLQEPLRRIAAFSEILDDQIADGQMHDAAKITAMLASSATDLRQRFVHVVNEIDNRNRRRASDDNLSFLDKPVSNQKYDQ